MLKDFHTPNWSVLPTISPGKGTPFTDHGSGVKSGNGVYNWHMLSVGGAGSGLPWHLHGQTWIGLTAGLKRWFVAPPDRLPSTARARGHPLMMAQGWANASYRPEMVAGAGVGAGLKECVQRPVRTQPGPCGKRSRGKH